MIKEYLFYFLIYSFLGWCTEVIYSALNRGVFINPGYLNGPYCPIYGFGSIFVLLSLFNLRDNKIILFFGAILITSILEFLVGWFLEKSFHQRFWDYSNRPFNIKGYICLSFSIYWGIGCVFIVDYLHPSLIKIYQMLPSLISFILIVLGIGSIFVDTIISTNSILKLNRELKYIHEISEKLRYISDEIGKQLAKTSIELQEDSEEYKLRLKKMKDEKKLLLSIKQEKLRKANLNKRRMLRSLPTWIHTEFKKELEELKENSWKK